MNTHKYISSAAAGCLVIPGANYLNTDIHVGIAAGKAATVNVKVQLLDEAPDSVLGSAITASSITHLTQNFQNAFISWTGSDGPLTLTIRQYGPIGG